MTERVVLPGQVAAAGYDVPIPYTSQLIKTENGNNKYFENTYKRGPRRGRSAAVQAVLAAGRRPRTRATVAAGDTSPLQPELPPQQRGRKGKGPAKTGAEELVDQAQRFAAVKQEDTARYQSADLASTDRPRRPVQLGDEQRADWTNQGVSAVKEERNLDTQVKELMKNLETIKSTKRSDTLIGGPPVIPGIQIVGQGGAAPAPAPVPPGSGWSPEKIAGTGAAGAVLAGALTVGLMKLLSKSKKQEDPEEGHRKPRRKRQQQAYKKGGVVKKPRKTSTVRKAVRKVVRNR